VGTRAVKKTIPFEAVRRLLTELGFKEDQVRDSHYAFRHESGALFLFRLYAPSDPISAGDLTSLRFHLDARRLLEQDAFEEWIQGVAV
jgi:hypothetical protein